LNKSVTFILKKRIIFNYAQMNKRKETSIFGWIRIKIRNRWMRQKVKWIQFKERNFAVKEEEVNIDTQKIIDLFMALLRNKNSTLNHSPESETRFIQAEFAWACLCESKEDRNYVINVIDESVPESPHSHEFLISEAKAVKIIKAFDEELERRFKAFELEKKKILASDISNLIIKAKGL